MYELRISRWMGEWFVSQVEPGGNRDVAGPFADLSAAEAERARLEAVRQAVMSQGPNVETVEE